jgi:hypothetical protein
MAHLSPRSRTAECWNAASSQRCTITCILFHRHQHHYSRYQYDNLQPRFGKLELMICNNWYNSYTKKIHNYYHNSDSEPQGFASAFCSGNPELFLHFTFCWLNSKDFYIFCGTIIWVWEFQNLPAKILPSKYTIAKGNVAPHIHMWIRQTFQFHWQIVNVVINQNRT